MFICEQASANLASEECIWVIDSSASFDITPSRECLLTYIAGDHRYVKMGDNGECRIVGVGNVCLPTLNGCQFPLKDVQHVPDIMLNLISTGRMDEKIEENHSRPQPSSISNGRLNGNIEITDFIYSMRRHWMLTWKPKLAKKPWEPTDSELSTMR